MNAPDTILAIAAIGGTIGQADGKLSVGLPDEYPATLKADIKANKAALLELVSACNFVVVKTQDFGFLFWVRDCRDTALLIKHGAHQELVYTWQELESLLDCNPDELRGLHAAKSVFAGRIAGHWKPGKES